MEGTNREGGNGGKKGKGHQGTCIKDPWTKPKRGWIEGGRWRWMGWGKVVGGNGNNCTWTTIKKKKKENTKGSSGWKQVTSDSNSNPHKQSTLLKVICN